MELNRRKKVFDWDKALKIIKEKKPRVARAGLAENWVWTYETICFNGQIIAKSPICLESEWGTPILRLDDENDIECYVIELKDIIEKNRDKEQPTYEVKTVGHEDRLSPEEEQQLSKLSSWDNWDEW